MYVFSLAYKDLQGKGSKAPPRSQKQQLNILLISVSSVFIEFVSRLGVRQNLAEDVLNSCLRIHQWPAYNMWPSLVLWNEKGRKEESETTLWLWENWLWAIRNRLWIDSPAGSESKVACVFFFLQLKMLNINTTFWHTAGHKLDEFVIWSKHLVSIMSIYGHVHDKQHDSFAKFLTGDLMIVFSCTPHLTFLLLPAFWIKQTNRFSAKWTISIWNKKYE